MKAKTERLIDASQFESDLRSQGVKEEAIPVLRRLMADMIERLSEKEVDDMIDFYEDGQLQNGLEKLQRAKDTMAPDIRAFARK